MDKDDIIRVVSLFIVILLIILLIFISVVYQNTKHLKQNNINTIQQTDTNIKQICLNNIIYYYSERDSFLIPCHKEDGSLCTCTTKSKENK